MSDVFFFFARPSSTFLLSTNPHPLLFPLLLSYLWLGHELPSHRMTPNLSTSRTFLRQGSVFSPDFASKSIQKSESEVKVQVGNAVEVNPNSDSKHAPSFTDSKPPDENPDPIPKDATKQAEEINIDGHPTEINNSNSQLESMSNSRVNVPDGTPEPPANFSGSLPSTQIADNNASEPQDEKMKKSMERAESGGKRSAKKVVRQKRWKG